MSENSDDDDDDLSRKESDYFKKIMGKEVSDAELNIMKNLEKIKNIEENKNIKELRLNTSELILSEQRKIYLIPKFGLKDVSPIFVFDEKTGNINRLILYGWQEVKIPRVGFAFVVLPDGNMYFFGGKKRQSGKTSGSADYFNPLTGNFVRVKHEMSDDRYDATAVALSSKEILIIGGYRNQNLTKIADSCEIFNTETEGFTDVIKRMSYTRSGCAAVLLANGKVLITGGNMVRPGSISLPNERYLSGEWDVSLKRLDTTEIYDPATKTFSRGPDMLLARSGHTATLLLSGEVLICGGFKDSAELYDPVKNKFFRLQDMIVYRENHMASILNNGDVLIYGGDERLSSEIFDHKTKKFHMHRHNIW